MICKDKRQPDFIERNAFQANVERLTRACDLTSVNRNSVKTVTEFGGGVGIMTRAILQVFPEAKVQMIDCEDQRYSDLKNNQRVEFIEEEFVKALESGKVSEAEVVVLYSAGDGHGFNEGNFELLAKAVGKGILIVGGHNRPMYDDTFYSYFPTWKMVEDSGLFGTYVWRGKQV